MPKTPSPPTSAQELHAAVIARYDDLSKQLKQVARYVLDNPGVVALDTLTVLAERCKVQPSTIVRFAKSFGFEGASQMQRLLRDRLLSANASLEYAERIRHFTRTAQGRQDSTPAQVLSEFIEGNVLALQHLEDTIDREKLTEAISLIEEADTVFVAGFRRAFPVAAYLAYCLHQVDKKTVFIDSIGGMTRQQIHSIGTQDLLLMVSYHPYAQEAVQLIDFAADHQCKVLSISDSPVSPVARSATLTLQVREAEVRQFRSLSTSMCLAQSLVIGYAFATAITTRNGSALTQRKPVTTRRRKIK